MCNEDLMLFFDGQKDASQFIYLLERVRMFDTGLRNKQYDRFKNFTS